MKKWGFLLQETVKAGDSVKLQDMRSENKIFCTPIVITGSWSKQNADVTARNSKTLNKKGDPTSPVTEDSTCKAAGNLLPAGVEPEEFPAQLTLAFPSH